MKQKVFILGAGGHAKVILDCIKSRVEISILGILDIDRSKVGGKVLGIEVFGEEKLQDYKSNEVYLINGVGSIVFPTQRSAIFAKFKTLGYTFLSVIHPEAYVAQDVILGEGVQIMAGAIVQPGCAIGDNTIINTRASIDHDCMIGNNVHLAPGIVCCGKVRVKNNTHVGTGAIIIQNIIIGDDCLIAAGAVVTKNVSSGSKMIGIPATKV